MATEAKAVPNAGKPARSPRLNLASIAPFVVFIIAYLIIPRFADNSRMTVLIYIGINVLLALGLNLLMGYAGQVSLGHAAFFGIGAYTSAILTTRPVPQESIPGVAVGIGIMAGCTLFISLARPSGLRFGLGVALLIASGCTFGHFGIGLIPALIIGALVMAGFGLGFRLGCWKAAAAGALSPVAAAITAHFLGVTFTAGGTSPWTGMAVGILVTSLVAYLVGGPVLRLKGNYLAMATLAFGIIVGIVLREWTAVTGGSSDGIFGIQTLEAFKHAPRVVRDFISAVGGGAMDDRRQYYYLVWAFVFVALLIANNIVRSRVGRAFRAVHGSEVAAETLGVDTERYKVQVFVLSAALASIAGSLYAHNAGIGYISPREFDFSVSVQLVVMVVVGGMASIWGALLGAGVIQILKDWMLSLDKNSPQLLGLTLKGLDPIVFGAVLIAVMVVLPQGFVRGISDGIAAAWRSAVKSRRQAEK